MSIGRQDYEERRAERIERLNARAAAHSAASAAAFRTAEAMGSAIPFGQPVHGQRDRAYRDKIGAKMDKSIEESRTADYYVARAAAAESSKAISSDDPQALEKLRAKVEKLKNWQEQMKKANAYYRKNKTMKGFENLSDENAAIFDEKIANAYSWEKQPFAAWELSNNNQTIHAAEERIKQLEAADALPDCEKAFSYFTIASDGELNRVTFEFDGIPSEKVRDKIKGLGFKWSPSEKKWMRLRTPQAWRAAQWLAESLEQIPEEER